MRNAILLTLIVLSSTVGFAQAGISDSLSKEVRNNELKIGAIQLLAGSIVDIEYERLVNKSYTLGGNVIFNFSDNPNSSNFALSPFFRVYFTDSKDYRSKGFFAQTLLIYNTGDFEETIYNPNQSEYEIKTGTYNSLGVGFGLGKKWVNEAGFLLQIHIGGARNLIRDTDNAPEFSLLGDVSLGYRF